MPSLSAWITLLVGIAGTAGGAVVATYLARMRINFEREESLRGRMLDAADDYSASATRAANALHRALHVVPEDGLLDEHRRRDPDSEEAKKLLTAIDEARPGVDEARANFTRVQLLVGPTSAAGKAALELIGKLTHVLQVLDDLEVEYAQGVFDEFGEANWTFMREARRALLSPSLQDPEGELSPEEQAAREALAEHEAEQLAAIERASGLNDNSTAGSRGRPSGPERDPF